jgi:hypothetical protein
MDKESELLKTIEDLVRKKKQFEDKITAAKKELRDLRNTSALKALELAGLLEMPVKDFAELVKNFKKKEANVETKNA